MVVVGDDDNGFLIELHHRAGAYPSIRIKAYALPKVQVDHRVDGFYLPKELQSLDNSVVEFMKLGFAQVFDLNVHGVRRRVPVPVPVRVRVRVRAILAPNTAPLAGRGG